MNYIIDKEQYQALKAAWKNKQNHSASEMIAYNILRGFDAKRGFTPTTNQKKLINGRAEWHAFQQATWYLKLILKPSSNAPIQEQREKQFKDSYGIPYSKETAEKMLELLQNV
jgi:hypothetical protein